MDSDPDVSAERPTPRPFKFYLGKGRSLKKSRANPGGTSPRSSYWSGTMAIYLDGPESWVPEAPIARAADAGAWELSAPARVGM